MSDRYFVESPIRGQVANLDGPEARHLIKVMRIKVGESIVLFDGSGSEFLAIVSQVGRANIEFQIQSQLEMDRESARMITLGVALPKGDRQRWLVEKCVELGVFRIIPLVTDRSVAMPTSQAVQRLRRYVVEASKQCGRNRLMEIEEGMPLSDFVKSESSPGSIRLIAEPQGQELNTISTDGDRFHVLVGPEGGLSVDEVKRARQVGWQPVSLGPRILRVETACAAMASWIGLF